MLLIVGSRRANEFWLTTDHTTNRRRRTARDRAIAIRHGRPYFENIANTVFETRPFFDELIQQLQYLALDAVDTLFNEQPTVNDHATGIRHTGRRISRRLRLPAADRVDIQSGVTRTGRPHRHIR